MADNHLGIIQGRGCAVARFADAMLRSLGGTQITLRIAEPSSGSANSQLGLEAPATADLSISPAIMKELEPAGDGRRRIEVVVSFSSLRVIAKAYGIQDLPAWLLETQGIVQEGQVMRIAAVAVEQWRDTACFYHLTATE